MFFRIVYSVCLVVGSFLVFTGQSIGEETRIPSSGKANVANQTPKVIIAGESAPVVGGAASDRSEAILISPRSSTDGVFDQNQVRRTRDGKRSDRATVAADFGIKITPQPSLPELPRNSAEQNPIVQGRRLEREAVEARNSRPKGLRIEPESNEGGTGFFGPKGSSQHSPGNFGQR